MREIEFRAWLKKEKKMVDVREINFASEQISFETDDDILFAFFDEIELMQYTGIKDKNGVEIYEGDILKVDGECNGFITYNSQFASFAIQWFDDVKEDYIEEAIIFTEIEKCEVIGNIYENPELLEV